MKITGTTAALAIALFGTTMLTAPAVLASHDQLEQNMRQELTVLGFGEGDLEQADDAQIAQIRSVLEGDMPGSQKQHAIEKILAGQPADANWASAGTKQLATDLHRELEQIGVGQVDVGGLTLVQVAEIRGIIDSHGNEQDKQHKVEAVLSGPATMADMGLSSYPGGEQLEARVRHNLQELGIEVEDVGEMTLSQATLIQQISESDTPSNQKAMDAKKALGM